MADPVTTSWGMIAAAATALLGAGGLGVKALEAVQKYIREERAADQTTQSALLEKARSAAESEAVIAERHRCDEQIAELRADMMEKIRTLQHQLAEARAEILDLRVEAARQSGMQPLAQRQVDEAVRRASRYKRERDAARDRASRQGEIILRIARAPDRAAELLDAVSSADPAESLSSILSPSLREASDPGEDDTSREPPDDRE